MRRFSLSACGLSVGFAFVTVSSGCAGSAVVVAEPAPVYYCPPPAYVVVGPGYGYYRPYYYGGGYYGRHWR